MNQGKKIAAGLGIILFVGCTSNSFNDKPTTSSSVGQVVRPPKVMPPVQLPETVSVNALESKYQANVIDWTSTRFWGDPHGAPDPRIQMNWLRDNVQKASTNVDWMVNTGSAVATIPVSWSKNWTSNDATDKVAFGVNASSGGRGINASSYTNNYKNTNDLPAGIFVLTNLYSATNKPDILAVANPSDSFGSGGFLFTYAGTGVKLYALSKTGKLYCYNVPDSESVTYNGISWSTPTTGGQATGGWSMTTCSGGPGPTALPAPR